MPILVDRQKCTGCGVCVDICPGDILTIENQMAKAVYPDECEYCGSCMMDCPREAIKVVLPRNARPVIVRGIRN